MGRYKHFIATFTALHTIWCERLLAAIPNWTSSGHLRRCSDADTHIQSFSSGKYPSILSKPIILSHYNLLMATFRAMNNIWCKRSQACGDPDGLIRSPTTL
eukprot:scaffold15601_cov100-Skeletonema_dohrnii-CCMP3373.AAC.1